MLAQKQEDTLVPEGLLFKARLDHVVHIDEGHQTLENSDTAQALYETE